MILFDVPPWAFSPGRDLNNFQSLFDSRKLSNAEIVRQLTVIIQETGFKPPSRSVLFDILHLMPAAKARELKGAYIVKYSIDGMIYNNLLYRSRPQIEAVIKRNFYLVGFGQKSWKKNYKPRPLFQSLR